MTTRRSFNGLDGLDSGYFSVYCDMTSHGKLRVIIVDYPSHSETSSEISKNNVSSTGIKLSTSKGKGKGTYSC